MKSAQTIGITVVGGVVILAGLIMLVIPGPGLLTVAAGLAILATRFAWAKKRLEQMKLWLKKYTGTK
jgi:uncharacterized protein (TIGR02611 family)